MAASMLITSPHLSACRELRKAPHQPFSAEEAKTSPDFCNGNTSGLQNIDSTDGKRILLEINQHNYRTLSDPSTAHPNPGGQFLRQTSLPVESNTSSNFCELKGILKRSTSALSESGAEVTDSDYASASPSPTFDFWYAFRSVDDVFSDSSDDMATHRKRVSFSEKIMRSTYRPGTCILQQKQKALKKREKRHSKDGRRTASESDASEMKQVTDELRVFQFQSDHSDFGLENEHGYVLEELVEVDEEQTREQAIENATKKRKNRKNRKSRALSESF